MAWFYLSKDFLFLKVNDLSDDKGLGVNGVYGVVGVMGVRGTLTYTFV